MRVSVTDLETRLEKWVTRDGKFKPASFVYENELFRRSRLKVGLDEVIRKCDKCPGLNGHLTRSSPGWGSLMADVMFLGQSLCTQCMYTQMPFTEQSGYYIDAALNLADMRREDCFWTNVVHCHPENNRGSESTEVSNCRLYLVRELEIVLPKVLITLGSDAKTSWIRLALSNSSLTKYITHVHLQHPASYFYSDQAQAFYWCVHLAEVLIKFRKDGVIK